MNNTLVGTWLGLAAAGSLALAGLIKLTTWRGLFRSGPLDDGQEIDVHDVPESGWVRVEFRPDPDVARFRPLDGWRRTLVRILLITTAVLFAGFWLIYPCQSCI